jgi:iron complex transport system ATP-binding protein
MPFTNWYNNLQNEDIIAVNEAISTAGIEDIVDIPLQELSDGMFQKTMIARALAQQSRGIALDEPSAYLDYASKHKTFLLLQQMSAQRQKCVLASSHDLDLLLKYANSLLLIDNGTVRALQIDAAKTDAGFRALSGDFL